MVAVSEKEQSLIQKAFLHALVYGCRRIQGIYDWNETAKIVHLLFSVWYYAEGAWRLCGSPDSIAIHSGSLSYFVRGAQINEIMRGFHKQRGN